jgi:hypothetical protein
MSDGLIEMWGHRFDALNHIDLQFQIISKTGNSYVVQVFSFADGKPSHIKVISRADILGDRYKLFQDIWSMNENLKKEEALLAYYRNNPPTLLKSVEPSRAGLH